MSTLCFSLIKIIYGITHSVDPLSQDQVSDKGVTSPFYLGMSLDCSAHLRHIHT